MALLYLQKEKSFAHGDFGPNLIQQCVYLEQIFICMNSASASTIFLYSDIINVINFCHTLEQFA